MYTPTIAKAKRAYPHFADHPRILAAIAENDRNLTKVSNGQVREMAMKYRDWYEDTHGVRYDSHAAANHNQDSKDYEGPQGAFRFKNVPSDLFDEIMKKTKKYKMQLEVTASWHDGEKARFTGFATKGN